MLKTIRYYWSSVKSIAAIMFSETFPEEIQRLAGEFLKSRIFVTIGVVGEVCSDICGTLYLIKTGSRGL